MTNPSDSCLVSDRLHIFFISGANAPAIVNLVNFVERRPCLICINLANALVSLIVFLGPFSAMNMQSPSSNQFSQRMRASQNHFILVHLITVDIPNFVDPCWILIRPWIKGLSPRMLQIFSVLNTNVCLKRIYLVTFLNGSIGTEGKLVRMIEATRFFIKLPLIDLFPVSWYVMRTSVDVDLTVESS